MARAEGIPLYAVETVRMLLQDGRLELHDGIYRPIGDLSTLAVPATLHALIAARLDALDATDRSLLQYAPPCITTGSVYVDSCARPRHRTKKLRAVGLIFISQKIRQLLFISPRLRLEC